MAQHFAFCIRHRLLLLLLRPCLEAKDVIPGFAMLVVGACSVLKGSTPTRRQGAITITLAANSRGFNLLLLPLCVALLSLPVAGLSGTFWFWSSHDTLLSNLPEVGFHLLRLSRLANGVHSLRRASFFLSSSSRSLFGGAINMIYELYSEIGNGSVYFSCAACASYLIYICSMPVVLGANEGRRAWRTV